MFLQIFGVYGEENFEGHVHNQHPFRDGSSMFHGDKPVKESGVEGE